MPEKGATPDPAQVLTLLQEALALEPAERSAFLTRLGETSPDLRAEVEDLLKHDRSGSSAMLVENLAAATRAQAVDTPELPPETDTRARYESRGEIARGGMGLIERAYDRTLSRDVARKMVLSSDPSAEGSGPAPLHRFLAEARVTGQLEHPGVVPVHELGVGSDGEVYFTMRLVRGRDFHAVIREVHGQRSEWNLTRALGVVQKVCETMAFAHDHGVMHRDLKPANVMVGRYGEVYVMDWGLARVQGHEDVNTAQLTISHHVEPDDHRPPSDTVDGTVLGTPHYMPPEQASGQVDRIDERSDVYSAGAMLYHLLAGRPPYGGEQRMPPHAVIAAVLQGPPDPLSRAAPDVAPELISICEKAMAREPSQRFASMTELAEDLRAYLEHRVVRSYRTGAVAELHKWVQRNRGLAFSMAATMLAVVTGLVAVSQVQASGRRAAELQAGRIARLTAIQELERLEERAARLWPAHPQLIPKLERWIQDATALLSGLDPTADSAPGHREQLRLLRAQGIPGSRPAELGPHPLEPLLATRRQELAALRAARRAVLGAAVPPVELPPDAALRGANSLNSEAMELVGATRVVFGREREGLALAQLALEELRSDPEQATPKLASIYDTLAFAHLAVGQVDAALVAGESAVAEATPNREAFHREQLELVKTIAESLRAAETPQEILDLERQIAELEARVNEPTWRFEQNELANWHGLLVELIADLERFGAGLANPDAGPAPAYGSPVPARLAFARELAADEESPSSQAVWEAARRAIADSPAYGGMSLPRQVGLLPLGEDPESGLWEFAHLQSGEPPFRRPDGTLEITEATGLVLVLIPAGMFHMGAQSTAPDQPGYDPAATDFEGPVHWVTLDAFFLSKHEMNQAQWLRATGENPSWQASEANLRRLLDAEQPLLHPVETVSWRDCYDVARWLDLELPTEAQWEYAVRAGTTEPYWTAGTDLVLTEVEWLRQRGTSQQGHRRTDLGTSNGFGLRNMVGNVAEWCQDTFVGRFYVWSQEHNPRCEVPDEPGRVVRGSEFSKKLPGRSALPRHARSAFRLGAAEGAEGATVGLRPARSVRP